MEKYFMAQEINIYITLWLLKKSKSHGKVFFGSRNRYFLE